MMSPHLSIMRQGQGYPLPLSFIALLAAVIPGGYSNTLGTALRLSVVLEHTHGSRNICHSRFGSLSLGFCWQFFICSSTADWKYSVDTQRKISQGIRVRGSGKLCTGLVRNRREDKRKEKTNKQTNKAKGKADM